MAEKIQYKLRHVGINCEDKAKAKALVELLCHLFELAPGNENNTHIFVSDMFEVMKNNKRGTHGHIALWTPNVEKAMEDLAQKGISFQQDTIRRNLEGHVVFIYLEGEFGGFSFHLTQ